MLDGFAQFQQALNGSAQMQVQVDAWYDGELVAADLNVVGGSVTADDSRAILTTADITFGSPDGTLAPASWDSPLACYGSLLHVRGTITTPGDPAWCSLGWFRIDTYDTSEWWQPYQLADGSTSWQLMGLSVENSASDLLAGIDDAQMLAPSQPSQLASTLTEIAALASGIIDLATFTVADAPIPTSLTYETSRTANIQALAANLACVARADRDGALTLIPDPPTGAPVWTVTVGADGVTAPLLAFARKGDRSGVYNGVVSTGQASDGTPTQGQAITGSGPLAWGGPFGQVPTAHSTPLLTSNQACTTDAQAQLATLAAQRTVAVPVTLPWNPALEVGDILALTLPDRTLTGPVSSAVWPLTPGPMTAVVSIPRETLWGLVGS